MGWTDILRDGAQMASSLMATGMSMKVAKANRNWMEQMSNTSHQREVKDLRAAGLNPILSATGGNGASTPTANTTPDFTGLADGVSKGVNTSIALRQQRNADKIARAEVQNKEADTYLKGNLANTESQNFANAIKQGQLFDAQTAKQINDIKIENARLLQDLKESDSRINVNSANSRYANERSRGFSTDVRLPFGLGGYSHSGNRLLNKKKSIRYEIINGKRVPVTVYD